jgi:hypothetical protein
MRQPCKVAKISMTAPPAPDQEEMIGNGSSAQPEKEHATGEVGVRAKEGWSARMQHGRYSRR